MEVANALEPVHALKIYHVELNPMNVLLRLGHDRPVVRIIDFESSYEWERHSAGHFYDPPTTPGYSAPEIARQPPDPRSDVFSLGAVLLRCSRASSGRGKPTSGRVSPVIGISIRISSGFLSGRSISIRGTAIRRWRRFPRSSRLIWKPSGRADNSKFRAHRLRLSRSRFDWRRDTATGCPVRRRTVRSGRPRCFPPIRRTEG